MDFKQYRGKNILAWLSYNANYEDVIQRNNLWHFFRPRREKVAARDDDR